jgi:hypothetical protein
MTAVGFLATCAASATIGGLVVAIRRQRREFVLRDELTPKCRLCSDTGVHVSTEPRPSMQWCICATGVALDRAASEPPADFANVIAMRSGDGPSTGGAA